jgi:glycosyltransferase involved in cell wall biosynthesis
LAGRRITLIANELRGLYPAAGMGTATTFLALALARMGHSVELLIAWQAERPLDPYWEHTYAEAGIRIRRAQPSAARVRPAHFETPHTVERALCADPPDVVIGTDLNAPLYNALRVRQAGLGFDDTLFVVFCHGTRRWILEQSRRIGVRDIDEVLATSVLERAAIALADVVVSPSAYLVGWMRDQGWTLPSQTQVTPYFTRSGATGETPPRVPRATGDAVGRVAFFGRLEDKKGIATFLDAVNGLDPALLRKIGLEFVGKPTASWTPERIESTLSEATKRALRGVSFSTDLDQPEALAHLSRPGTLTVVPSLGDNSPNTVYECLEYELPFLASSAGGIPELIAEADRARVLFQPTVEGTRAALERALSDHSANVSPTPAFSAESSAAAWAKLVDTEPRQKRTDEEPLARVDVFRGHLEETTAPYVVFLREGDAADDELVRLLVRAQAATGADAVTCATRVLDEKGDETLHFFSGEPHGLGALANDYGTAALFRREVLDGVAVAPAEDDPHWPLLANLVAAGRNVVSLPLPLVTSGKAPGTVDGTPGDALLAVKELERALPPAASSLARLAAGLAAARSARSRERPSRLRRWRLQARSFARKAL